MCVCIICIVYVYINICRRLVKKITSSVYPQVVIGFYLKFHINEKTTVGVPTEW